MQRFDAVVAISRYIAADFERAGIPRDRIRQVYDGIALERWVRRPSDEGRKIRTRYGVPDDTMLVVLVGLLRFWKGQDVALVALLALDPEIRHRVRLWLVGSAPASDAEYADYLQRFVSEHGLTDIVQFLGFRTDVPEIMGAADVVLHASSVPEPFGLVVLEGLAQGKPVIASKLGGPSEILRPGEGLLFDPKRPEELARILTELVSSPETRRRLGECGHTRARDFDVRDNVKKVAHIWGQIMCR